MRFKVLDNRGVISTHTYRPETVPVGSIVTECQESIPNEFAKFGPDFIFNVHHVCVSFPGDIKVFFLPSTDVEEIVE